MYVFAESASKMVVFLNVPFSRKAANAAKLLTAFVRQAARGGSLPAERNIKKHHYFFRCLSKHIHSRPERREKGRAAGPGGGCVYPEGQVYDGEKGREGV